MNICKFCDRKYEYSRSAGHQENVCNSCRVNIRRFKVKERCVEYKGGKCSRCGYNRCITASEFHHTDKSKKEFSPGGHHCRSWSSLVKELDKCILLCSNCHREEEFQLSRRLTGSPRPYTPEALDKSVM